MFCFVKARGWAEFKALANFLPTQLYILFLVCLSNDRKVNNIFTFTVGLILMNIQVGLEYIRETYDLQ
jgi:hypothetical protein